METIIVQTEKDKLQQIIDYLKDLQVSYEVKEEQSPYDPAFVAKIKESEIAAKNGEVRTVELDSLSKKYSGKLPSQIADQIQEHIKNSRNEWNNSI